MSKISLKILRINELNAEVKSSPIWKQTVLYLINTQQRLGIDKDNISKSYTWELTERVVQEVFIKHYFRTGRKLRRSLELSLFKILHTSFVAFTGMVFWALFEYPIRRLVVRSREDWKPRDVCLELSYRSGISQAPGRQYCRNTRLISQRCDNSNYQFQVFEASRNLMIRRLIEYWNGALVISLFIRINGNSFKNELLAPELQISQCLDHIAG